MHWNVFPQPVQRHHFGEFYKFLLCDLPKKRAFSRLFWNTKWTYQTYIVLYGETFIFCSRNSKLYAFQYVFLCCGISRTADIASLSLRWPICQIRQKWESPGLLVFWGCPVFPFQCFWGYYHYYYQFI